MPCCGHSSWAQGRGLCGPHQVEEDGLVEMKRIHRWFERKAQPAFTPSQTGPVSPTACRETCQRVGPGTAPPAPPAFVAAAQGELEAEEQHGASASDVGGQQIGAQGIRLWLLAW